MLDRLLKFEEHLARAEAVLLVVFVGLMLGLATYNVFYRNVLVPIQVDLLTEEPAESDTTAQPEATDVEEAEEVEEAEPEPDDGAAGFGGGFGEAEEGDDGAAGFGGGFDDSADEEAGADEAAGFGGDFDAPSDAEDEEAPEPESDGAAGFGGDFGAAPDAEPEAESEPSAGAAGFGGDFGDVPESDGAAGADDAAAGFGGDFGEEEVETPEADAEEPSDLATAETPQEAEEPWLARFIDAIKLEWIDQVLRQLVLVVGFLGAMIATRRRKHITIDALSKLLEGKALHWVHLLTNSVSIFICVLLAKAGKDLVSISVEYPKEIVPGMDEWMFQLIFPVGFGMLALHFGIRWIETLYYATGKADPRPLAEGGEL